MSYGQSALVNVASWRLLRLQHKVKSGLRNGFVGWGIGDIV